MTPVLGAGTNLNEGILENNIPGVKGGHKTIFERPDEEGDS
jgi:hypothetical protein